MCLAVPARVTECAGDDAVVDLQGNTLRISRVLTPEAGVGDWVLVHAGFAITRVDEAEARQIWEYLEQCIGDEAVHAELPAGTESPAPAADRSVPPRDSNA